MNRALAGHLGTLASGVATGLVIRFVQGAALARLLGVTEFGKLATVAALMAIVSRLNDLGLPSAVAYHFRRAPGAYHSLMRVIALDFAWCCVASVALAAGLAHTPLPIAADLRGVPLHQLVLAGYIAFNTPTWIFPGFVSAAGNYGAYVRITNLDAGLQAAFAIGACLAFGPSYLHVIAALAIEQALMSAVYLWYLRRYRRRVAPVHLPARDALSYGLRLQWGVVMKLLSSRADVLTVGALAGPAPAGLYSVALNLRDIGLLPQSVYAAPYQNLIIDRAEPGRASDREPVMLGLVLQVALSIAMALAAGLALPFLLPAVYGPAFREAVAPAVVLFASVVFLGPAGLCWMTFNAKGRPDLTSLLLTAAGILGPLVTYLLLVSGHGLVAVAMGGLATAALTLGLCAALLQRVQHYRRSDVRVGLREAGALSARLAATIRRRIGRLSQGRT